MKKHILFICRYNRFRSIIAEGFFNEYNKNKNIIAKSAAPIRGGPISDNVKNIAKELKIKIKKRPQSLTSRLMRWQDVVVIVADDVPKSLFTVRANGKKVIRWPVPDVMRNDHEEIMKRAYNIKKRVIKLVRKANKWK